MAITAQEFWKGTNGDAWPVGAWHNPVLYPGMATASTIDIQSNVGRLLPSTANATVMGGVFLRRPPVPDCDVTLTIDHALNATGFFILSLRSTLDLDANARPTNSVNVVCSGAGDTVAVDKEIAGANTSLLAATAFTQTNGTPFSVRARVVGPSIKVKWWTASGNEPSAWNFETNDPSPVFPGYVGLSYLADASGNSAKFTNFSYTDLTPAPPLLLTRLKTPRRRPIKAAALVQNPNPSEDDPATAADAGESIAAALTDTDSGSAADAGESITVAVSDTDSGTAADTGTVAAALTDTDSGSAVDAEGSIGTSDSDTGAAADAESVAVALTDTETAAGADAGESLAVTLTDTETGAGADAGESIAVTLTDTETAGGVDDGTIAATLSDTDSGSAVDDGTVAAVELVSDTDTGTAADAGEAIVVNVSDSDTGAAVDDEAISAAVTDTDDGMSLDLELELLVALADAEAAIAADTESVSTGTVIPDTDPIMLTYAERATVGFVEQSVMAYSETGGVSYTEPGSVVYRERRTLDYRERP